MKLLVAAVCAAFVLGCGGSTSGGLYTADEVLVALEARGLTYEDRGPSDQCWEQTDFGPRLYEGDGQPFVMWVYDTGNEENAAWDTDSGPVTRLPNGLVDMHGCFESAQMWVARRANVVVGVDRRLAEAAAGTPSELAEVLSKLHTVTSAAAWQPTDTWRKSGTSSAAR